MVDRVVLDTSTIIEHLRGRSPSASGLLRQVRNGQYEAAISTVTVVELLSHQRYGSLQEREKLLHLLVRFDRIHLTYKRAIQAGTIRRDYGVDTADAIVAQAALEWSGGLLATEDKEHFIRIKGIRLLW